MGVWMGKGQFGFLDSHGNSDAESVNGNVGMTRYDGAWKNELYVGGLYGKNAGIVSAERWETRLQSNYTISGDFFAFGGLRFEHDMFDGFQYQASATGGLGYKFLDTDSDKLVGQIGAGYRETAPRRRNKYGCGRPGEPRACSGETSGSDRHGGVGFLARLYEDHHPHQ